MGKSSAVGSTAGTATPPRPFRADIQGLRAVAVVLVVLDHTFRWPTGGFVGVDVFYVISGFLITSLLLRELNRTGSISLRAFYARRVKRIMPAAVLVLFVTVGAAFALWYLPRALQTLLDAASALLFVSNWHFMAAGTDYLQAAGAVSPVQHFWSLSVEEQFYAVWPIILLLSFLLVRGSRRALIVLTLAIVALSVIWAALQTSTDPTGSYFDTFGRVWELLAGATLAMTGTAAARLSARTRGAVSIFGVLLILASAVAVDPGWALPVPGVIPAVLGAVIVIWATAPSGRSSILGNPVSQWLGDVSYSLYLWHFPVLIFAFSLFGDSLATGLFCIPVMLILSDLSRRFVEQPVVRSRLLLRASHRTNDRPVVRRDLLVGVSILVVISVFSVAQARGPATLISANYASSLLPVQHIAAGGKLVDLRERQEGVTAAVNDGGWGVGVPQQLDSLFSSQQGPAMLTESTGCRNEVFQTSETRICGDAGRSDVMVVGDSVALSWVPTVEAAVVDSGSSVSAVGFANCSLIDVDATNRTDSPGFQKACSDRRDEMLELVDESSPSLVVLSASETAIGYTDLPLEEAAAEWQSGVERTLNELSEVPLVVLITNPPFAADPNVCATRFTGPDACTTSVSKAYSLKAEREGAAAAKFANVVFIDSREWFCDSEGNCPPQVSGTIQRTDTSHLTEAAATELGPLFAGLIRKRWETLNAS